MDQAATDEPAASDDRPSRTDTFAEITDGTNPILAVLRGYLPGRRGLFTGAVAATVTWRLANLVAPYLLGLLVDGFLVGDGSLSLPLIPAAWVPSTTRGQFGLLVGFFLAASVVNVASNGVRVATWRWFRGSVLHDLRVDAYEATQRLDVAFFVSEQTGDVLSVLSNDVNQLGEFLDGGLQRLFQTVAFFIATLAAMLALHWQLTLVVGGLVPLMLGIVAGYQRVVEPRYDERRTAVGRLNARVGNAVDGIRTIKAFTAEGRERDRLAADSRAYWRVDWAAAKLAALFQPTKQAVSVATMLVVAGIGGSWVLFGPPGPFDRPLSAGTLVVFWFYSQMFVAQSSRLGDVADSYTDAKASARRVLGLLHYPHERKGEGVVLDDVQGRVTYEDVTFSYPDQQKTSLAGCGPRGRTRVVCRPRWPHWCGEVDDVEAATTVLRP